MKKAVLVALAMLVLVPTATAGDFELSEGTMQLGGVAALDVEMTMPEEGDSTTGYLLGVAPTFGYFIMDNLELFGGINAVMGFGDAYEGAAKNMGFDVGAKYFMGFGAVTGYAGLSVGMAFMMPDEGDTMKNLLIGVPLGVLYPLNEHVALDLGTVVNYNMSLEDGGGAFLNVPLGYLGVQAFF